ncbi:MAG: alpha-amylase family glycosyl hydrolase [Rikenellaceae bacterium]
MKERHWSSSSVVYELNIRQFTAEGTFSAAQLRLPFLRAIGVDVLWLMPIFPIGVEGRKGSLGSYYSIQSYCAVNEEFGTMAEFDSFLLEAHELGFIVLLDWVANHTSRDALWLTSKPADWYERDSDGLALVPYDWSDTAKLNYDNMDVWAAQIEAMRYWLQRGVDGFRCDMAMLVPIEFWRVARRELTEQCGDLFMIAEAEGDEFFNGAFDACYGWDLHHLMVAVARGEQRADAIRDYVLRMNSEEMEGQLRLLFTSNHDENSWQGSDLVRFGDALPVMQLLTFVLTKGLPLIYMGQEVGYDHSFDFFNRDPMPESIYVVNESTRFLRTLVALRRRYDNLWGATANLITTNADDSLLIIAVESTSDDDELDGISTETVIAMLNLSPYAIDAEYDMNRYQGEYSVIVTSFDGDVDNYTVSERVTEQMPPWSFRVMVSI